LRGEGFLYCRCASVRLFAVALAVASMGCVCLYVEGMVNLFNRYGGLLDPPFFFFFNTVLFRPLQLTF